MDDSDKKEFAKEITGLSIYYNYKLSKEIIALYFKALQNYSIEDIKTAFGNVVKYNKFFPKISDINEYLGSAVEDKAIIQCNIVFKATRTNSYYESICFDDPVTMAVIEQQFGGWLKLCNEVTEENEPFMKKDFIKCYSSYHRNNIKRFNYFVGLSDSENESRGISAGRIQFIGDKNKCKEIIQKGKKLKLNKFEKFNNLKTLLPFKTSLSS